MTGAKTPLASEFGKAAGYPRSNPWAEFSKEHKGAEADGRQTAMSAALNAPHEAVRRETERAFNQGMNAEMTETQAGTGLRERGGRMAAVQTKKEQEEKRRKADSLFSESQKAARLYMEQLDVLITEYERKADEYGQKAADFRENVLDKHYELMEDGFDLLKNHKEGKADPEAMRKYLEKRGVKVPDGADTDTLVDLITRQLQKDQLEANELERKLKWLKDMEDIHRSAAKQTREQQDKLAAVCKAEENIGPTAIAVATKVKAIEANIDELEKQEPLMANELQASSNQLDQENVNNAGTNMDMTAFLKGP